ncbi:amidase [Hansschlegelia plantiphila]|uniref:Amidase n=1 Tax=Hansschlegelia plantiphila TaxID=374655 RepID=A0A9W6J1B8_9HYPH|nr:amidase [Hansschlegelia plantiphila]GLK67971.1 amidase [Hansschlegelia plantiphila]
MPIDDPVGAFVAHGRVEREGAPSGPLAGLTFALKDLFDLDGVPTGAGNPDWLSSHEVPTRTAPVVQRLLDAGARLVGKTHTDEIAWSLNGENFHYGAPVNVAAPGRIPGGSSSGSAAAVAAGLVDFAIGSDTGGSVRLPASYCGLYGLRPTHGRIPIDGAVALAPSYDVVGWFSRDPELFAKVGKVLLGEPETPPEPTRLLIADDMFEKAEPAVREALRPALERIEALFGEVEHVVVAGERASAWRDVFRVLQSSEAWALHGEWVERVRPSFGPGVKERFEAASKLTAAEIGAAQAARAEIKARMEDLVPPGSILVLPTTPGIAPLLNTPEPELNVFRARALEMLCPAGHAGMPQISLPFATVDGCPVGLSLLAPRFHDETLLELAIKTSATTRIV